MNSVEQPAPDPLSGEDYSALTADDLTALVTHFDLGAIESTRLLDRGTTHHPKTVLQTPAGELLLKRRVDGVSADDPRIDEVHRLYQKLLEHGYPLPPLVVDPVTNTTTLVRVGVSYELTHFIHGVPFDRSVEAASAAGSMLARFHQSAAAIQPPRNDLPMARSFHNQMDAVTQLADAARRALTNQNEQSIHHELESLLDQILAHYQHAGERVSALGFERWPRNIVHGDWHPGNLLYQSPNTVPLRKLITTGSATVVAVLDLDSIRFEPRSTDVANGCLQFSMQAIGSDPRDWPEAPAEHLLLAFCEGYDEFNPAAMLSTPEIQALTALMIEALIAECLTPIAATGSFLNIPGLPFLHMIERKVRWLDQQAERVCLLLNG